MRVASRNKQSLSRRRSSAWLGLRITFSGLLCMAIVVLVGLAALNSETNLLFLLFGISLGVVGFSALAPLAMVRDLEVERIAPAAVIAGRPFTIGYCVRNRRRWIRSWSLVVGEVPAGRPWPRFPLGFVEVLDPGCEARIELTSVCPVRGRVPLKAVRLLSRFPFGLFACSVDVDLSTELVVYPAVGRLRGDPWHDRHSRESMSSQSSRRQGHAHEEFYGVREYRPGDNLRWIHWRRSARVGQLIVREGVPARAEHLTVLLDPWAALEVDEDARRPGGEGRSASSGALSRLAGLLGGSGQAHRPRGRGDGSEAAIERIISLAATVLCEGLERGHRVGLIARGAVPVVIAPAGGRPHRQRLLHELALLRPGGAEGLDGLLSRIRWSGGWHGRCLLCATHYGPTHSRVMRFLAGRAESAVAISADSEAFHNLFEDPSQPPADRGLAEHEPAAAGGSR